MADAEDSRLTEDAIWEVLFDLQEKVQNPENQAPLKYEYPPSFSYFHSEVEVKSSDEKGRGYFAKADIAPGTLLLVERPLVSILDCDVITGHTEVFGATTAMLTLQLVDSISKAPDLISSISELHPQESDYDPIKHEVEIDSETLKHSMKTAINSCAHCDASLKKRLSAIVRYNQIAFYTNNEQLCFQTHYASSSGTGLYPKASIFNHNCIPNAVYYTIDNVLVIHSSRQIKAGEEICFSYMQSSNLADSALFRNVHLDRDFICGCPKCTRDLTKRDIRLIKDPNAVDPAMGEVLTDGILEELWKMDAFERMSFAAQIKEAENDNFKKKDHIEYSMLMAISYQQCVQWEKSLWFWEVSISACSGIDDHDELVKLFHACLAALALNNQQRFRHHLTAFLRKHRYYCGGGFRNLRLRYEVELESHPIGPKLKKLFWMFSKKLFPSGASDI